MRTNLSRFQVVVVLAYLAIPLLAGAEPAAMRQQAASLGAADGKVDASSQRIQQMEAELRALQAEAAKNPARPTMADIQRGLDRMVAERHGDSEVSRLERRVRGSVGVSLVLAVALGGALLKLRSSRSHSDRPVV